MLGLALEPAPVDSQDTAGVTEKFRRGKQEPNGRKTEMLESHHLDWSYLIGLIDG